MKNARRVAVLVLSATLLFSTNSVFLGTSGVAYFTSPTFNSVVFDKTSANVDEVVRIYASFSDAESGIDYGQAHLNSPNNPGGEIIEYVELWYNVTSGFLQGQFDVNKYWYADLYIESVWAYDNDGNYGQADNIVNYTSPILKTFGNTPDYEGPVFNWVQFDRSSANANDKVSIFASFSDLGSGVRNGYVYLNSTNNPEQYSYLESIYLEYNEVSGYFEGIFEVYQYWPADLYIAYIEMYDFAGHMSWVEHNVDYNSPILTTFGTTPDYDSPIFNWVQFDRPSANVDEIVTILVSASDSISGLNFGYAYLDSPNNTQGISFPSIYLEYNPTSGYLEGSFEVLIYWPADLYITQVHISDIVGNRLDVFNNTNYSSPILKTYGNVIDVSPPILHSVWFDKTNAYEYEPITVFATITDDLSGVDNVYANFWIDNQYYRGMYLYFDTETGSYRGEISFYPGELNMTLREVYVYDYVYNYFSYNETHFSTSPIYSLGEDTIPPVIMTDDLVDYGTYWGEFLVQVSSTERGDGNVYLDGYQIAYLDGFNGPEEFWFNTYEWENGLHVLTINAWDYADNTATVTFNIYIVNERPDQNIEVNVIPNRGESTVGDTVSFEVKILSNFDHDMSEVELKVQLKSPNGGEDIVLNQFFTLEAQMDYFFTFEIPFKETGFYHIEAILFDDIGVTWSQGFEWVVNPNDHTTITETDP
ncbi:MAG: hypothetical protein ACXAC2_16980, partial [Candidatus Kariarchaeaceae archaeon]